METRIEFTNGANVPMRRALVDMVVREALSKGVGDILSGKNISLEVALVSREEIKALNRQYRDKDAVTDVLSFSEYDDVDSMVADSRRDIFLGQVVMCYDYIVQAAKEDGVPIAQELAYILSHGVLHLLGYDHTEEMFRFQDDIARRYAGKEE